MKTLRSTLAPVALFTALIGGAAATLAGTSEGAQEGAQEAVAEAAEGQENELHESMEVLQKNMKALRKLMRNPEEKETLFQMCADMEEAALTGFMHPPASADGLEGSELRAYQADFKKRMLNVASTLVDLELAIDAGDADTMKTIYRSLGAHKKEGHDIYIK
ncbi:MAG: cytochrome b562 [Planctomycetota bacterium]